MNESEDILQIREWLETQEEGRFSLSHKAALIRSCDPFGLIADYKDENGTIDCKVEEDRYGLKGYIKWNTERNEAIKTVSSIHLDQNPAFKRYFRWKI